MSDIQITMSPGESSAMEKNRAEKEKLQRKLALLDRELRERCDELSKLGFEMCQMDKHNQEYTTGDSVLMRNQSKSKAPRPLQKFWHAHYTFNFAQSIDCERFDGGELC